MVFDYKDQLKTDEVLLSTWPSVPGTLSNVVHSCDNKVTYSFLQVLIPHYKNMHVRFNEDS